MVAEPFKDWHKAFWDNLATSIELHNIKRVIAINHRDCGAAEIAYGEDRSRPKSARPRRIAQRSRNSASRSAQRHPKLEVETGLMAINGKIEMIG